MKTFQMRDRQGKPIGEPVEYHGILVDIAGKRYTFALHKVISGAGWQVSDPESGARVAHVGSFYSKEIRFTSNGVLTREARARARTEIRYLIARVGEDEFLAALAKARTC